MFALSRMKVGMTPPIEYKTATDSETYTVGEALKVASGAVTKCTGATKPAYVCVGPVNAMGEVPCVAVQDYMEFESSLGVAPAEQTTVAVGNKVTLHTDGLQVTATTSGVATITYIAGQTVGSLVRVRF